MTASELDVPGQSTAVLVALCRRLGARTYLSGISGREYLDESEFAAAGIEVEYQEFYHPVYRQLHEPFQPCMSFVDLLFSHGADATSILLGRAATRLSRLFT